ncbi:LytR/AlgR family response regulator transcription factor [Nonlabens dokdonensis]|uniref:Response regulator n=2 Tax=Nonlabens dokdonensis TaxID=328515 RepID=L7W1Z5_NONDD|nr:LytTR family DNA-binding domain-containing protein [Nonlabens dokdonensis]AGC75520.1 response regulator [Nonlabens dokdonensis DSW-6]
MKAILIDDEPKARKLLQSIITEHCPDITALHQAEDLGKGTALIKQEQPDLVFLDIEMPQYSGLQILEFFDTEEVNFQIIFITAYNQYAVDAFKLSAVDYLLKPVDVEELKAAVKKAIELKAANNLTVNLAELKRSFQKLSHNKIALDVPRGIIFINHQDVMYLEADGMYTTFYLKNGDKELICKPLRHFVEQMHASGLFYKPHRSYYINLNAIKEFNKKEGGHLIMENDKLVPISRDKRTEFFEMVKEIF